MPRKLIAAVLAASLAFTSFTAAPARAADEGEIGRFLLGAGALLIIGSAIANQNRRDRDVTVNRRYVEPTRRYVAPTRRYVEPNRRYIDPTRRYVAPRYDRKVVPAACIRSNRWDNGPRRYFGSRCLQNNMPNYARLPGACQTTVWTNHGRRTVFAAECLRRHGWRFS